MDVVDLRVEVKVVVEVRRPVLMEAVNANFSKVVNATLLFVVEILVTEPSVVIIEVEG